MLNLCLLADVQVDLDVPAAVQLDVDSLANDLRWEDQVLQDVVVDHGQCSAARALLLALVA